MDQVSQASVEQAQETQEQVAQTEVETTIPEAKEGFVYIPESFHFKGATKNVANLAKLPQFGEGEKDTADRQIKYSTEDLVNEAGVKTGEQKFQRDMETYNLLIPTVAALGMLPAVGLPEGEPDKASIVLQHLIKEAVVLIGRDLVKEGKLVTDTNCNWDLAVSYIYGKITSTGTDKVSFPKELLAEVGKLFAEFSKTIGKPENGIEATLKMIAGRFNKMSVRRYMVALPAIKQNIEHWFLEGLDEEQQTSLEPVSTYLLKRIDEALKPEEEVDVGSMF